MTLAEILAAVQAGEFADLTADQLTEGRAELRRLLGEYQSTRGSDEPAMTADEAAEVLAQVRAVDAEFEARSVRDVEAAEFDAAVAAVLDEPEVEEAPAAPRPSVADIAARRPAAVEPEVEADTDDEPKVTITAAAGGPGSDVPDGATILASASDIGRQMLSTHKMVGNPTAGRVMHRYANVDWRGEEGVDRVFTGQGDNIAANFSLMQKVMADAQAEARQAIDGGIDTRALQAASGICGPSQPIYDVFTIGDAMAGAWSLPELGAPRGSVTLPVPLTYDDLRETAGIAFPYDSSDGDGTHGTVTKACYEVPCAGTTTWEVVGYQTCRRFSNFQGLFNPEWVAHVNTQSLMTHSHRVQRALLASLAAAAQTTAIDADDEGGGAIVQVARHAIHTAALYRDRYRLDQNTVMDVVLPAIVLDAMKADIIARSDGLFVNGRLGETLSAIQQENSLRFQFVTGLVESAAAPGGFGDQEYNGFVYPAGAVVRLSQQTLDLGEVRDSTYNAANEFGVWVETFDGLAVAATEVYNLTGLVACPSGEVGNRVTIACTSGASAS